jgi:hypothetical protein
MLHAYGVDVKRGHVEDWSREDVKQLIFQQHTLIEINSEVSLILEAHC